ncbi:MAG: xanthine dehydrogenase accessory protein XdhC [Lysobacterales bacterium]
MNGWVNSLHSVLAGGDGAVLVTLVATRGSSPRSGGAKMVVAADTCLGSIGGGALEHQCITRARDMLSSGEPAALEKFTLGTPLDQCCGGVVEVLLEPLTGSVPAWLEALADSGTGRAVLATALPGQPPLKQVFHSQGQLTNADLPVPVATTVRELLDAGGTRRTGGVLLEAVNATDLHIAVFGAGHVGRALVGVLADLHAEIRWIDDRDGMLSDVPGAVSARQTAAPASEVASMPPGSFYLVMTHSHALDLGICTAVLERGDAAYCGLIGSATKRRHFEKRFLELGLEQSHIDKLTCPIGIGGIAGKQPAAIAIATAAEILQVYERLRTDKEGAT